LEKNPLLKDDNLPEFDTITIEKCTAAIGRQTVEFEEKMKSLEKDLASKHKILDCNLRATSYEGNNEYYHLLR
jgi:oligopeptidase A